MNVTGALAAWPRRRWVVAATGAVLLLLGQAAAVPAGTTSGAGWWALTAGTAALAGLVLASYAPVPGSGWRLAVGCTPCAALAGVLAAFALLSSLGNVETSSALLALALTGAAAYQRFNDDGSCTAPAPQTRPVVAGSEASLARRAPHDDPIR